MTALAASPLRPGEIYVGTAQSGIYRSLYASGAFQDFAVGLEASERRIYCLKISALGDRLYAGTLGGLAVRALQ